MALIAPCIRLPDEAEMLKKTLKELGFHSFIYMLGGFASNIASIILLPIYSRILSPEDYGMLEVIDNLRSQLVILFLAGLIPAMAKFYKEANSDRERKAVIGTSFWFILFFGIAWLIVLLGLDLPIAKTILGGYEFVVYIDIGIMLLFIQAISTAGSNYLNIVKKSKLFLVFSLIKLAFNIILNLYFIIVLNLGAKGMLLGELYSSALVGVVVCAYLVKNNGFNIEFRLLKKMFKFGFPFVPNAFGAALMHGADRSVLLPLWPSVSELGIYGLGYRFPFMLNFLILGSFGGIWNSSGMYEVAKQKDNLQNFAKIATYFTTLYVVCAYVLASMAPILIKILAAPEYFSAWEVVQIISLGLCFYSLHQFFIIGAFLKGNTWYLPFSYIVSAFVNISLNFIFLPKYGYIAAAWITFITYCTFSLIGYFLFRNVYPIPFEFRRLGFLFLSALIFVLLNDIKQFDNVVYEAVKESFFAISLPFLLIFGPYFNDEEKDNLKEELNKIHPNLALIYGKIQLLCARSIN